MKLSRRSQKHALEACDTLKREKQSRTAPVAVPQLVRWRTGRLRLAARTQSSSWGRWLHRLVRSGEVPLAVCLPSTRPALQDVECDQAMPHLGVRLGQRPRKTRQAE
jgi:hypothetical protein